MKTIRLVIQDDGRRVLDNLQRDIGAESLADLFRKSLALARICVRAARDSDGVVNIGGVAVDLRS